MEKGRVKWFNQEKGFGFIERPGLPDLFLHIGDRQVRTFEPDASGEPKLRSTSKPWNPTEERQPRRDGGDWIYYEIGQSTRGTKRGQPKAMPWEFAEAYDQAKYESLVLSGQPKSGMPFDVAAKLLAKSHFWCLRDCAFGDEEFGWDSFEGGDKIASGIYNRSSCTIWVDKTQFYLETIFTDAEAKRLYDAGGKTQRFERNDAGDPREW